MVAGKRRGHGEDSIYFDQVNRCWVGAVSLGYSADGKRRRRTVRGHSKTEVRDKLRALREDIAVSVKAPAAYSVQRTVDDWLASGLNGRSGVARCLALVAPRAKCSEGSSSTRRSEASRRCAGLWTRGRIRSEGSSARSLHSCRQPEFVGGVGGWLGPGRRARPQLTHFW